MSSEDTGPSRTKRLVFCVVVLVAFVGVFLWYYRGTISDRKHSIVEGATASLAFAADDLGSRLANWRLVTENAGRTSTGTGTNPQFEEYIEKLVPGLSYQRECGGGTAASIGQEPVVLRLRSEPQFAFEFSHNRGRKNEKNECATTDADTLESFFKSLSGTFEDVLVASDDGEVHYQLARTGPRITQLNTLIAGPEEASPELSVTDRMMSLLAASERSGTEKAAKKGATSPTQKVFTEKPAATPIVKYSRVVPVSLNGEQFLLAVQPIPLSKAENGQGKSVHLVLAGLMKSEVIEGRSRQWPKSATAWIGLGMVILYTIVYSVSCIPMKAPLQPVGARDIALVCLCALVSCSALAIGITHWWAVKGTGPEAEKLTTLSDKMRKNLREELCNFYQVLDGFYASEELAEAAKDSNRSPTRRCVIRNLLVGDATTNDCRIASQINDKGIHASAIAYSYPFFDYVLWSRTDGSQETGQIAKWSIRQKVTPPTKMTQFHWFQETRADRLFRLHAKEAEEKRLLNNAASQRIYVEPLRSPNTGEYLTAILKRFDWKWQDRGTPEDKRTGVVGTLIAPLSSLNAPVFPPGYGFMVIDPEGTVLYSTDQRRNQRENLLREAGVSGTVASAIANRTELTVKFVLRGEEVLAHIRPLDDILEGANWTIITYRNQERDNQVRLDTFIQTMKLTIPHVVMLTLLTLCFWLMLRGKRASHLFPSMEKGAQYLTLLTMLALILVFTWMLTLADERTTVFLASLLLPPVVAILGSAFLSGSYRTTQALACLYPAAALVNFWFADSAIPSMERQQGYWNAIVIFLGALILAYAFFLKRIVAWWRWVFEEVEEQRITAVRYKLTRNNSRISLSLFTWTGAMGLFLMSAIPMIGYYRTAFQMVNSVAAVDDLFGITHRLEERALSAIRYYGEIRLHSGAQNSEGREAERQERERFVRDRLELPLDRYDFDLSGSYGTVEANAGAQVSNAAIKSGKPTIPWIDKRLAAWLPLLYLRTPANLLKRMEKQGGTITGVEPSQVLRIGRWPVVQLDYRSELIHGEWPNDFSGVPGGWSYHHQATIVPDLTRLYGVLWYSGFVLVVVVWVGVYWTVRILFLTHFRAPEQWPAIRATELQSGNQSLILLKMTDAPDQRSDAGGEQKPAPFDRVDLRAIQSADKLPDWPRGVTRTVYVENFDFSFDSEESAKVHLEVLEKLCYSARRRVILAVTADPEERIGEMLSRKGDSAFAAWFRATGSRWERLFLCFERKLLVDDTHETQERARRIYMSCTDAQRAVVYQIAHEGWVNPNNKRALRGLIARGWVTLKGMPKLSGDATVLAQHIGELTPTATVSRWNAAEADGSWWILLVTVAALFLLAVVLLAGNDLIQSLPGVVTGVVAGLPAVWRGVSSLRTRAAGPLRKEGIDV